MIKWSGIKKNKEVEKYIPAFLKYFKIKPVVVDTGPVPAYQPLLYPIRAGDHCLCQMMRCRRTRQPNRLEVLRSP
jgi:hypothetical protein